MRSALLTLKSVAKTYRTGKLSVPVLQNINLEIHRGSMTAIMGPSGSGKSTLMNIIGLLDRPSEGELFINEERITLNMSGTRLATLRAENIGFVFQSFNLLPKMSALTNVLLPTTYFRHSESPNVRAMILLKQLGLSARMHHKPSELSGGEKQRVAIARALINDPDIILADEPTGNLDSKSGADVIRILSDLHKSGKTVIIVTHDESIAKRCERIVHIFDGQIQHDTAKKGH